MPELINKETQLAENVPAGQAENAFTSGSYNLPADKPLVMADPKGKLFNIDPSEAHTAITDHNYTFASPEQISEADAQQKYGEGALNTAKAFGAGAARTATFGLSDEALTNLKLTNPETLRELRNRNPIATGAGETAGIVAPMLVGDEAGALNLPNLVAKGGEGITAAARAGLPEATTLAGKILQKTATKALGSAVEGAAYGAGNVVSEHALGDPDLNAEKIASEIGLGAVFGGAVGGALELGKSAIPQRLTDMVSGLKDDANAIRAGVNPEEAAAAKASGNPIPGIHEEAGNAGTIESSLDSMQIPAQKKQSVFDGLTKLKPNSDEIVAAANEIGAPVLESQVSASKHVQDVDSMLSQSPTTVGVKRQQLFQQGFDAAENAVKQSLGTATNLTEVETGNLIKKGLTEAFEKENQPIKEAYNAIKELHATVPLSEQTTSSIAKQIMEIDGIAVSPSSPEFKLAQSVSDEIKNLQNVDQLKSYRSSLSRRAQGNPELKYVTGQIQNKLATLEDGSIERFARDNFQADSPYGEKILKLIDDRKAANGQYKALREKMGELGDVLGKKRIYGPQDFLDHLENLTPEAMSKKLFTKGNSEFLQFFKEQFPSETKLLVDLEKSKLSDRAMKDGVISPNNVLREFKKYSPEVKKILFSPDELKKLEASKTYLEAMPADINPSKTSKSEAYRRYFTNPIAATGETLRDSASLKAIQTLVDKTGGQDAERLSSLIRLEQLAQKTTQAIQRGTQAIFRAAQPAAVGIAAKIGAKSAQTKDDKDEVGQFETRRLDISRVAQNPSAMLDALDNSTRSIYPNAPNISASLHQTSIRGVQFLNSKLPKVQTYPLGPVMTPSKSDISKFNRYYKAVENPTSILNDAALGMLVPEGVEAVQSVYPKLFQEMQKEIYSQLTDKKQVKGLSYKSKMMLSMLMGTDLDGTTTPQAILSNQMAMSSPQAQNQSQPNAIRPTQKGASSITLSDRSLTPLQRSAARTS